MDKHGEVRVGLTPCEDCGERLSDFIDDGVALCTICHRKSHKAEVKSKKIQKVAEDLNYGKTKHHH